MTWQEAQQHAIKQWRMEHVHRAPGITGCTVHLEAMPDSTEVWDTVDGWSIEMRPIQGQRRFQDRVHMHLWRKP